MKFAKPLLFIAFLAAISYAKAQEDTSLVNVYFFKNKYFLTETGKRNLKAFIDVHKNDKNLYVVGRCDKWGALEYNDWLSVQRAQTVAKFMQENGFPVENIDTIKGYGKRKQLAVGTPKTVDSLNRVVTITGSFAVVKSLIETKREAPVVKETPKPAPPPAPVAVVKKVIDTVYLADSIMVPPPYSPEILAINPRPKKGDILKIERSVNVSNDTPYVMKKLYVASETMEDKPAVAVAPPPAVAPAEPKSNEVSEDSKDLNKEVSDKLKNTKVGESLVLRGINFDNGYHTILKKDMPALQAVLSALKEIPTLKVEIQGHVCCWPKGEEGFDRDTKEYNLSYNRAQVVYQWLVDNGIDKSRLTFNGYGMKNPLVYPEKNKSDQYKNRRVEFKVTAK